VSQGNIRGLGASDEKEMIILKSLQDEKIHFVRGSGLGSKQEDVTSGMMIKNCNTSGICLKTNYRRNCKYSDLFYWRG